MKLFRAIHKKCKPAVMGICLGLKDFSIRLQIYLGISVFFFSTLFQFHIWEWIYVIISIGLVITIEYLNSAIERMVDYISPEYTKFAQQVKDLAAAAVLIISIFAAIGYLVIIGGKLL